MDGRLSGESVSDRDNDVVEREDMQEAVVNREVLRISFSAIFLCR